MPKILCIDTSADICSVVLGDENGVKYERVSYDGRDHSTKAGVFVNEILNEAEKDGFGDLDAIAVCSGPGSYTGLRIGVSLAKGLCYGFNIPLLAVDSLKLMAQELVNSCELEDNAILCPMIDARRMEVYASLWDTKMNQVKEAEAVIVDENSYSDFEGNPFYFFGTGAEKCQEYLSEFTYIADKKPMAHSLLKPAIELYVKESFEDLAYFEPFYLKQFQTTVSKKNLLGL